MGKKKYGIRRKNKKNVLCDCEGCQKELKFKPETFKRVNDIFDGDKKFFTTVLEQHINIVQGFGYKFPRLNYSTCNVYFKDARRSLIIEIISTKKEKIELMRLMSKFELDNRDEL